VEGSRLPPIAVSILDFLSGRASALEAAEEGEAGRKEELASFEGNEASKVEGFG
jgi:hypothetical protein